MALVTDLDTLINASGCYSAQTLGLAQRMSVDIANLAKNLASNGGTDYTANLDLLITDSVCWARLQPDVLHQVESQIISNNATNAGATVGTIDAQVLAGACIVNASKIQLEAAKLFLIANLGTGQNPPA